MIALVKHFFAKFCEPCEGVEVISGDSVEVYVTNVGIKVNPDSLIENDSIARQAKAASEIAKGKYDEPG